jgi:hypothetical protein
MIFARSAHFSSLCVLVVFVIFVVRPASPTRRRSHEFFAERESFADVAALRNAHI